MSTQRNPVAMWLESREGEAWSRDHHRAAHAGESHLPNHIASIRPTPGRDPVWDRSPRAGPVSVTPSRTRRAARRCPAPPARPAPEGGPDDHYSHGR